MIGESHWEPGALQKYVWDAGIVRVKDDLEYPIPAATVKAIPYLAA